MKNSSKISNEAKVGLLAIVTMATLYFGFNFLKGSDVFSTQNEYHVIYDNVDGLAESNPVTINGLGVGRVQKISLLAGNRLLVRFGVPKDIKLTSNTKAVLADGGFFSSKAISLLMNAGGKPLNDEDTLGSMVQPSLTGMIKEKTFPVLKNADSLITNLNKISHQFDQTGAILKMMLLNANKTTLGVQGILHNNEGNVQAITVNTVKLAANLNNLANDLGSLTRGLKEAEQKIQPILSKSKTIADSVSALRFGQTVNSLNQSVYSLQGILNNINQGKGTLGQLTKNDSLYIRVSNTTASLDTLLTDLKKNPKRYVHFSLFGRKK